MNTKNLIPNIINPTPDYYCTWQTQLYATSDGKPEKQREIICEKSLFEKEKPYGWAYFYEMVHKDLFLVMDDSWDVPKEDYIPYYGSLRLDKSKFEESYECATERIQRLCKENSEMHSQCKISLLALKELSNRVKELGWKGLGGWVCAQESPVYFVDKTQEEYWTERLKEMQEVGFAYWKVDWGTHAADIEFRKMLTKLGKKYAPKLVIEQAVTEQVIPYCDVYRTYDVPAIMSIPMTLNKIEQLANIVHVENEYESILNCEDEAYIAAAAGFSMGIMRHPYAGNLPDGRKDMSFPDVHRNLKTKMMEVVRAVNWHKLAPAYSFDGNAMNFSDTYLSDTWNFEKADEEIETWWFDMPQIKECMNGKVLTQRSRAVISRNTELPVAECDENGEVPFVIASKNPNGLYSIATLGRTFGREYKIPLCNITANCGTAEKVGVFGEYKNLNIRTSCKNINKIFMQDLAGEAAVDITSRVDIINSTTTDESIVRIPGKLIHDIGVSAQPKTDSSEPGVVVSFEYIRGETDI